MIELISTISTLSGTCVLGKFNFTLLWIENIPLGLVLGELLHRLSLYKEELHHIEEKQYQTSSSITPLSEVFNNKHNQTWKLLVFLCYGILLIIAGEDITSFSILSSLSLKIFAVAAVWALVRMYGITDNILDDMEIFSKH